MSLQKVFYNTLTTAFAIIYALTVTPFTVNFFRRFVTPPDSTLSLFNWDALPLSKVHEFFLPLFIFALEVISLRLAIGIWIEYRGERADRKLLRFLIILFLFFQAFPTFSVFYDARRTEYDQLQSKQGIDPIEDARAEAVYQAELSTYNQNLAAQQDRFNTRQGEIQNQIATLQDTINKANSGIFAYTNNSLNDPNSPAEGKSEAKKQIDALNVQKDRAQRDTDALRQQQQQLTPPVAGQAPVKKVDETKRAPLSYTDVQYMTNQAFDVDSILSFFVALIFPTVVFGAGYVFSNLGERRRRDYVPEASIAHELEALRNLPAEQQVEHAGLLKSPIGLLLLGFRTTQDLTRENTGFHIKSENTQEFHKAIDALIKQIKASKIIPEAQGILIQEITRRLATTPASQTSSSQSP